MMENEINFVLIHKRRPRSTPYFYFNRMLTALNINKNKMLQFCLNETP